ncbi:GSCOCG00000101001-RA-CDS, partial [Cotesia congregata]
MSNKHLQIKLNGELIEPSIIVGSSCLTKMILYLLIGLLVMETRTAQGLLFRDHRTNEHNSLNDWPYFEENVPRNVTTAISQTAFLHCRVHQRGDKE